MGEGEQKEENKKMVFAIPTILVCLAVMASIILAPNVASLGTDVMSISDDLKDVALNDVVDLDKKTIDDQILKGEPITLYVGGQKVSFKLVENDIRAVDFSIRYSSGLTLKGGEARAGIVFYRAMDIIGANFITATFTSGKMHFAIDMPDGKTYNVDALDGTGRSGHYLTYCPDDVKATEEIDQNAAVTVPVSRGPVNVEGNRTVSSSENDTAVSTRMAGEGGMNTTTQNASEGIVEASDRPSTVSATNETLNFKSIASYPNEKSTIVADVALIADYEFSTRSTWISDMLTTFYDVQGRMESQTGIFIDLASVDQTPQNACTSTDSSTLLGQFRSWVATYNLGRNQGYTNILFSGKTLTGGQCKAYETGTGLSRLLGSSYNGYGCTVVQQTFTQAKNTWMVGHGIALTFNADENWGEYNSGIGSWMWPFYANSELAFEPQNIQRMQTWMGEVMQNQRLVKTTTTTQDGFQISNPRLITEDRVFQVGMQVTACFEIKNLQSVSVTLPSLYFGAVNAKGECKDFGVKTNVVIGPGQTYPYWVYFTPDSSGEWNICPARYYNGNWNWFNVNADNNAILHPTFYYELESWEGHLTSAYSTDLFAKWGLYATSETIGPGQEVMTTFTMFNTAAGTSYTTYNWFFMEVRCPQNVPHDFGGIQNPSLSQRGNGYVGGGIRDVAYTTFDQSGVWKLSPCFQTSQGQWGPWMGPRYIEVGVTKINWSTLYYGNSDISLMDLGTKAVLQLPTSDTHGATVTVGFLIENFLTNIVPPGSNTPGVQIKLAHAYLDNDNSDDWDGHNGLYHIKLYITRVSSESMGYYQNYEGGGPYGTSTAFSDSKATFLPSGPEYDGSFGTNCEYYSRLGETNPDVTTTGEDAALEVIEFVLMEALGVANPYAAFVIGAAGVVSNLHNMLNPDPDDYYNQQAGSSSASWADWYTTPMPNQIMNAEDDVTSSYNFVNLYTNHTNDEYAFKIWAEVSYAYDEEYYPIGFYRATDIDTVSTPPIYLVIEA